MTKIIDSLFLLFKEKGASLYGGEEVTQLAHALQSAFLAKNSGATSSLITAALLHDVGHLLHDLPNDAPDKGVDDFHENLASSFLKEYFPASVTEPIRLHVDAKRYLCATDSHYLKTLSEASLQSLILQGGVMSNHEIQDFEKSIYFKDAIELRKWDDLAKDVNMLTPYLEDFTEDILRASH